jgi:hypothetical protein
MAATPDPIIGHNVGFNLAYIVSDFMLPYKRPFDQGYMRALFEYGYEKGKAAIAGTRRRQAIGSDPSERQVCFWHVADSTS